MLRTNTFSEKFIRAQSGDAITRTYNIIQSRIDQFGTKQPTVTLEPNRGRITVEIAGVDNPARVRKLLQATASLEFWETYKATEIAQSINEANTVLKNFLDTQKDLNKDSTVAAKVKDVLTGGNSDSSAVINPLTGAKEQKQDTSQAKQMEKIGRAHV